MAITIIDTLKPKNNGSFPVVETINVATVDGKVLDNVLKEMSNSLSQTYTKPVNGIPLSDLTLSVQDSLAKADSALQSYVETDPTVPNWAKSKSKPTYDKTEVGLDQVDNVKQFSASNKPTIQDITGLPGVLDSKQPVLTSDNAGTGIMIVDGVISVSYESATNKAF